MSFVTTFKGRQVEANVSNEKYVEDSFLQSAYWLDVTDANDDHPALSDEDLEELQDECSEQISENWSDSQIMKAESMSEGDR